MSSTLKLLSIAAFLFGGQAVEITLTEAQQRLVKDWDVQMQLLDAGSRYKVDFSWTHNHTEAVFIEGSRVTKPTDDPRCSGDSELVSPLDDIPYWMPRMFPREVPQAVTDATGIRFASVDWQPCGHKDITICHAESHYDFHLYYVTPVELLERMPACEIGSSTNGNLPVCRDSATNEINHAYFKLLDKNGNIPKNGTHSRAYDANAAEPFSDYTSRDFSFCVDQTSAIMQSGVHYGDSQDTLEEWKSPVTIIGSHNCTLLFFEPMFSWRWMSNRNSNAVSWPGYEMKDLNYHQKTFKPLPTKWSVVVTPGCRDYNYDDVPDYKLDANGVADAEANPCSVVLSAEGETCSGSECNVVPEQDCSAGTRQQENEIKECTTGQPYPNIWEPSPPPSPAPSPAPAPSPSPSPSSPGPSPDSSTDNSDGSSNGSFTGSSDGSSSDSSNGSSTGSSDGSSSSSSNGSSDGNSSGSSSGSSSGMGEDPSPAVCRLPASVPSCDNCSWTHGDGDGHTCTNIIVTPACYQESCQLDASQQAFVDCVQDVCGASSILRPALASALLLLAFM